MVSAPEGLLELPLVVSDDRDVDYVVVYAHGEKIAWAPGGRGKVKLAPEVNLLPGINTVYVEAGDSDGLVSMESFAIRGESGAAADAAPE